jgi:Bacterial regulatory proteins, luxR family
LPPPCYSARRARCSGPDFLATTKTVERHLSNLYRKLGVSNRTEAVTAAIQSIADSRDVSWRWDVEGKH